MRCWIVRRKLGALAAGELNARKTGALRAHLRSCPACAEEFASMGSALDSLRRVGSEVKWGGAASAECWSRMKDRLNRGEQRLLRRPIPVAAAVALAGVLLVAAGVWLVLAVDRGPSSELSVAGRTPAPTGTPSAAESSDDLLADDYLPVVQEYDFDVIMASDVGWGRF